jgi:hypothetical protein
MDNFDDCNLMSKNVLEKIVDFRIMLVIIDSSQSMHRQQCLRCFRSYRRSERILAGDPPEAFQLWKAVERRVISPYTTLELQQWVKVCLVRLTAIKMLTIWLPSWHINSRQTPSADGLTNVLADLGQQLGGSARRKFVRTDEWETWFWEAPKGESLKWTEGWVI